MGALIAKVYDSAKGARRGFDQFLERHGVAAPVVRVSREDMRAQLACGTVVMFVCFDSRWGCEKLRGIELTWVEFDDYSTFTKEAVAICWSRVRR